MNSLRTLLRRQRQFLPLVRNARSMADDAMAQKAYKEIDPGQIVHNNFNNSLIDASMIDEKPASLDSPFLKYGSAVPQLYDYRQALAGLQDTKVTTLPNGFRVATEYVPFTETATVGVWIDAGSRYETDETSGTAHFLEHIFFKGTKSRTVRQLEEEIEDLGGHLNAYTAREQTCYYAKCHKDHVPKFVDIVSDMLLNANIEQSSIDREKDVILREMQEVGGVAEEVVFDHLHATAFQYSPLGRTILGSAENVQQMTRENLQNYIKQHYTAGRMVLVASGNVNHEDIVKQAETLFSSHPETTVGVSQLVKQTPTYFTGSEVRFRDPDMDLVNMAIAFQGASWTDPDAIPLMVMQTLLGSWDKYSPSTVHMGSRLAQVVASNNDKDSSLSSSEMLCQQYSAFNTNYKDSGLFGVYMVADKKGALDDLVRESLRETTRLMYNVNPIDLVRARNQLKSTIMFSTDTTTGIAEEIGRQLLVYGRRVPRAEMFSRIDAVDSGTIGAVADRFIYDQDVAAVFMGDTWAVPDYNDIKNLTSMYRF